MKKLHLFALAGLIMLGSCTMEKRHFLPGYYTDFKKNRTQTESPKTVVTSVPSQEAVVGIAPIKATTVIGSTTSQTQLTNNKNVVAVNSKKSNQNNKPVLSKRKNTETKSIQSPSKKTVSPNTNSIPPTAPNSDMPGWAYILIALLLPPLAVGLKYGVHLAFWLCLLFTLLGFLPGLIYALVYFALQGNNPE